jgi:phosphoribosylformylglycinamidine synthase
MVQTNTMQGPGSESGLMRIKGTTRGLAMSLDGNSRWCYLDPKLGAQHAVAESARKVACTGAVPVAATNCLNFGNPEKPEIMAQLSAAIDGIAAACTALETPITGGNVSLYNETRGEGIYPTPVLGIVGIIEDISKAVPSDFQQTGDAILLLSTTALSADSLTAFGSSEYAKTILGKLWGTPPPLDLKAEANLQKALTALADKSLLRSARDISDGGLAVTLAESCFGKEVGAMITLEDSGISPLLALFGEDATRVLISCHGNSVAEVTRIAAEFGLTATALGITAARKLEIRFGSKSLISETVADLKSAWSGALKSLLSEDVTTRS